MTKFIIQLSHRIEQGCEVSDTTNAVVIIVMIVLAMIALVDIYKEIKRFNCE